MLVFTKAGACVGQVIFPPLSASYTQLPYISRTTLVRYLLIESLREDTAFRPVPDTWNAKMNAISQHPRQRISFPDRYRDDPSPAFSLLESSQVRCKQGWVIRGLHIWPVPRPTVSGNPSRLHQHSFSSCSHVKASTSSPLLSE